MRINDALIDMTDIQREWMRQAADRLRIKTIERMGLDTPSASDMRDAIETELKEAPLRQRASDDDELRNETLRTAMFTSVMLEATSDALVQDKLETRLLERTRDMARESKNWNMLAELLRDEGCFENATIYQLLLREEMTVDNDVATRHLHVHWALTESNLEFLVTCYELISKTMTRSEVWFTPEGIDCYNEIAIRKLLLPTIRDVLRGQRVVNSPLGIDGDPKNKIIAAEVNGIVDAIPTKALRTITSAKTFTPKLKRAVDYMPMPFQQGFQPSSLPAIYHEPAPMSRAPGFETSSPHIERCDEHDREPVGYAMRETPTLAAETTDTLIETLAILTNARLNDHVLSHASECENKPSAASLTRLDWQFVDAHKLIAKDNESETTYIIDIE